VISCFYGYVLFVRNVSFVRMVDGVWWNVLCSVSLL